jgi:hypothetical protein
VIEIFAISSIWTVLEYYCISVFFFFFFLSLFYCRYNANFFLGLTATNFIGVIFLGKMVEFTFAKSCLPAVHNIEFARGQRKALQLSEPE